VPRLSFPIARLAACGVTFAALALVAGCASRHAATGASASADATLASGKGGAQLWTENCSRCHNVRSPDYYSRGQWAIVAQHMRVRGYLTGEEERQITAFLQAQ
jgi:cytochrome c5